MWNKSNMVTHMIIHAQVYTLNTEGHRGEQEEASSGTCQSASEST